MLTKLKRASSTPALHEARPLLVAITVGLILALTLTVAAAWRPDRNIHIPTHVSDTIRSR